MLNGSTRVGRLSPEPRTRRFEEYTTSRPRKIKIAARAAPVFSETAAAPRGAAGGRSLRCVRNGLGLMILWVLCRFLSLYRVREHFAYGFPVRAREDWYYGSFVH